MNDFITDAELLNSLIDIMNFKPAILGPSAWIEHTPFAYWFVASLNPKVIVDLGVHYGVSYFSFCQAVKDNNLSTKCYAVDNWKGDLHTSLYSGDVYDKVSQYNNKHFRDFSVLLKMDFDDAVKHFKDSSIDFLHIDGYHTYEAVKHDFETWLPKLTKDAFVLLHDTNVKEKNFGVWRFWEELKKKYPINFEFYHGYGLGILQISENGKTEIINMLNNNAKKLRTYFHCIGKLHRVEYELNGVYYSKSWKITKPLRWLKRKFGNRL